MRLQLTPKYLVAFAALTLLCGTSHEFVHHFAAAAMCGCFGVKTFNSFELCTPCQGDHLALFVSTWAGPLFTYALLWLGWWRLRSPDPSRRQLGFALIFANFPVNRLFFAALGWNDEQYVTRKLWGDTEVGFWLTLAIVWLCAVPPLVAAFRAIENRRRLLWFAGFFLLPFAFVVVFAGAFLEQWLLLDQQFLAQTIIGIPALILVVEVACLVTYAVFRRDLARATAERPPSPFLIEREVA